MSKFLDLIAQAEQQQDAERRQGLRLLGERLHNAAINAPCDLSATAPEHHVGHKAGHKQARHQIAEMISEMFSELLND